MIKWVDTGWWTIPLSGELKRLADGAKTVPIFERGWKEKYSETRNTTESPLMGLLTGEKSGVLAVDCDNDLAVALVKAVVGDYSWRFESVGKAACTWLFKWTPDWEGVVFKSKTEGVKLDFFSDGGMVYLPTEANETKVPWRELPPRAELTEMPATLAVVLNGLRFASTSGGRQAKLTVADEAVKRSADDSLALRLGPMVEAFTAKAGRSWPRSLFRVLTPRSFRDTSQYLSTGWLHPRDVPAGRGSEYLMKVSAILGADYSVSPETYVEAINLINNSWESPMEASRLENTIINPMLSGNSQVDGKSIWCYNESWESEGLCFVAKTGDAFECFFDELRDTYYLINFTTCNVQAYGRATEMHAKLKALANIGIKSSMELAERVPIVYMDSRPELPFGYIPQEKGSAYRRFNSFWQSPGLKVLYDPDSYSLEYREPTVTLKYLETLVPDKDTRDFLLGFLYRKLTTFEYSPIVVYFLGVHGSGKDTFVELLKAIVGEGAVSSPKAKVFLEPHNGWIRDKYFIQLDEYGNQVSAWQKDECLGLIKTYSGKSTVQIREMRTDAYTHHHSMTIILTSNKNPLLLEEGDRRMFLCETPNKLIEAEWIADHGGISEVLEAITVNEVVDFCYWMAKHGPRVTPTQYQESPLNSTKEKLICESLPLAKKIAHWVSHGAWYELGYWIVDNELQLEAEDLVARDGQLNCDVLLNLYTANGGLQTARKFRETLKESGVNLLRTERAGVKFYAARIHGAELINGVIAGLLDE